MKKEPRSWLDDPMVVARALGGGFATAAAGLRRHDMTSLTLTNDNGTAHRRHNNNK
jgi:hypothetical protein